MSKTLHRVVIARPMTEEDDEFETTPLPMGSMIERHYLMRIDPEREMSEQIGNMVLVDDYRIVSVEPMSDLNSLPASH